MRLLTSLLAIATAGMVALYPFLFYPGHPNILFLQASAFALVIVSVVVARWWVMIPGATLMVLGYAGLLIAERGAVEITAPLFGLGLALMIESFDLSVAASGKRSLERAAVQARFRDLLGAAPLAMTGALVVLFAGVYGGDGGVLIAGLGALCVATAFGVLTRVAHPDQLRWAKGSERGR